jgi:DNA-directed RNA polymerase specialized sigma24 family protein
MPSESQESKSWWQTITRSELLQLREIVVRMLLGKGLGSLSELEDVVQEALVKLFLTKADVNVENNGLVRFTYVVAYRTLLDQRRRKCPGALPEGDRAAEGGEPAPDPDFLAILDELDPLDRYLVWRHVIGKRSVTQVASEAGIHWRQASRRIKAALDQLRRHLAKIEH